MKELLEIERVFLLGGMPVIPLGAERLRIEQGYFASSDGSRQGRIRRTIREDGSCVYHENIKRGQGRVRHEAEGPIDAVQFEREWCSTLGRRIRKNRHRVSVGSLVWEIDEFLDFPLFLAEIELPTEDHLVEIPPWLASEVLHEVTSDARYHNYSLAVRGPPTGEDGR
ncbi:MAG: adenylate cyclase [Phycisphaerales bacterium]|nr:adenylate cyclase [Phycisphaerales bacterium]